MATKTTEAPARVEPGQALEAFAQRLRRARRTRKISSRVLADYCGVSEGAVRQWENGNITCATAPADTQPRR